MHYEYQQYIYVSIFGVKELKCAYLVLLSNNDFTGYIIIFKACSLKCNCLNYSCLVEPWAFSSFAIVFMGQVVTSEFV